MGCVVVALVAAAHRPQPHTHTHKAHTQPEIPPGKQDFQSMNIPLCQTQTPRQQRTSWRLNGGNRNAMQTCIPETAETRDRTGDLQIFGLTPPQLSYRGRWWSNRRGPKRQILRPTCQTQPKTLPRRLELPTLMLTASRSNQLSYGSHCTSSPPRTCISTGYFTRSPGLH